MTNGIKNGTVSAKLDSEIKERATQILNQLGLSSSTLIQMVFTQLVNTGELPIQIQLSPVQKSALDLKNGNFHKIGSTIDDVKNWINQN